MPLIFKDKFLGVIFGGSAALILITLARIIFWLQTSVGPFVIHFNAYRGTDFIGGKFDVLSIIFSGFIIILIDAFLANYFYDRERFFSYLLAFISLVIAILILIVMGVIMAVN